MPNDLRVRGGTIVANYPPVGLEVTDIQFENAILDFCEAKGIPTTGSKQAILDRFIQHLWDDTRAVARAQRRRKKLVAAGTAIDAEINSELGV